MTAEQVAFCEALERAPSPMTREVWAQLWREWRGRVNLEPLALIGAANGWEPPNGQG